MDQDFVKQNLVCVLFPGIVKNDDKAIDCLGGLESISSEYSQPSKKGLGLTFQPDNPLINKVYADGNKAAGLLIKVKVKKTKNGSEVKKEVVSTSILGRVKKLYKFDSMCDFQYLPISTEGPGPAQCILEKVLPQGFESMDFLNQSVPLFLAPANFSRQHKPYHYQYYDKKYNVKEEEKSDDAESKNDLHQRLRSQRSNLSHAYMVKFDLFKELPTKPAEIVIKRMTQRIKNFPQIQEEMESVKKMFEERPIASANYVRYVTKLKWNSLKIILPCLGLYMKHGPWKMMWIKFGYDPRKEPESRMYQCVDFRFRHEAGVYKMIKLRHENERMMKMEMQCTQDDASEAAVIFTPGVAPSQRQIYYQFCDIKVPEVQDLVSAEAERGMLCHEKWGWLPPGSVEKCRDIVFNHMKEALLAQCNADRKLEQQSSDSDTSSDEDAGSTTELDDSMIT